MTAVFVGWAALAQDEPDGRLPGAMPVHVEAPPLEAPAGLPPTPTATVDHTKIAVLPRPEAPAETSPPWWLGAVALGVFGAVLGAAFFAARLVVAHDEPEAAPTPAPSDPSPPSAAS
jgi:hypothetical protein